MKNRIMIASVFFALMVIGTVYGEQSSTLFSSDVNASKVVEQQHRGYQHCGKQLVVFVLHCNSVHTAALPCKRVVNKRL